MTWRIRRAVAADAETWADCHRACWQEAYGPIADPALLAERLADREGWVRRVADQLTGDGPPRWLAVTDSGEAIGLSVGGPAREEVAAYAPEQLYAVYVREAWHGRGVGQALLDRAIGTSAAALEVLEDNRRAQAFYTRNGFAPTGVRKRYESLGAWEIVMARAARHRVRPAAPDDVGFLRGVTTESRGQVPDPGTSIVEVDGQRVGLVRVVRTPQAVELADIHLLPEWSGRGIAGSLLRSLAREAHESGRPLVVSAATEAEDVDQLRP